MSDIEKYLIEKSKQGDLDSFEKLIKTHQKIAFNIAYRMLGNIEDANDAAQEAFIKVYKSIKGFNGQSSFSSWLYKIVTNTCLDELRRKNKLKICSYDHSFESEENKIERVFHDTHNSTETIIERRESIRNIQNALNQLPEQHRTMIILRDIKGFSYEQISEILECPEGTIKSRISRARTALKSIMEQNRELYQLSHVNI